MPLLIDHEGDHARDLKAAYEAKDAEAKDAWAVFETERRNAIESGVDLTKDVATMKRLDDLHKAYSTVADEAGEMRDRLTTELLGMKGSPSSGGMTPGRLFAKD